MHCIYIDIGNTNIKYLVNDSNTTELLTFSKANIFFIFKKYKNYKFYIINTNKKAIKYLSNKKYNIFNFNYTDNYNKNDFSISKKFKKDEIGNDIWMMIYYLNNSNYEDEILISLGTYNVYIIKSKNKIISINLDIGFGIINNHLFNKFELMNAKVNFFNDCGTDTYSAISLTNFLKINGIIDQIIKNFKLDNPRIIICGNDSNIIKLSDFSNVLIMSDLVIKTFRNWCNYKLIK